MTRRGGMGAVTPATSEDLTPAEADSVRGIASRAAEADGVAPLSEQFLLSLTAPPGSVTHMLSYAGDSLAGYAQLAQDGSAELVVDPARRLEGHGRSLLDRVLGGEHGARIWAHGNLPAAVALAQSNALHVVRELHRMSRPLTTEDVAYVGLPEGFTVRVFDPATDAEAWVETNAAAFADHPEQGAVDLAGLRERTAQPWFDPTDLLVIEDTGRGPDDPAIAAFHWTKVDPDEPSTLDPTHPAGEVYVLGVHPAYQGRGLAGPLTHLGLAHLARRGLPEVVLYVDGDNERAVTTYVHAGFTIASTDVMYAAQASP